MSNKKVIGIDLASSMSVVAVIENGKPVAVANDEGDYSTPSVISLNENERKIGASAKRQRVVKPKETVNLIKRFMGLSYDECQEAMKHIQYDVVNVNGNPRVKVGEKEYSPEELSSMIIAKLKKTAEDYLGCEVTDAVISVPAFFNDVQRNATKLAGELAGLNVLRIIAEPTAAMLSSNIDLSNGGHYMVVDIGGATTDISVAEVSDGMIEILANDGDVFLGGSNIDSAVADYLLTEFKKNEGIDLSKDTMALSRVLEAAEKAKVELSNTMSADVNLPYVTVKDNVPVHMITNVTRAKFEQLATPFIEKAIQCGKNALESAKVSASDLKGILLVGGSCRIPLLQDMLQKAFNADLIKSSNFDLAIAEGCAIQANTLVGGEGSKDILLVDVCPLTLGIESLGGVMTPLIEANSTIPCRKSQIFTTAVDGQSAVTINVCQGERPLVKDNKQLGLFNLEGITPAPRGIPQIEVTFELDANSILSVKAVDKATGKEQSITIESKNGLTDEEIERIKADAKAHEAEDAETKKELEKMNKCESTIFQTERSLEELKDNAALTEEDKTFFNEKLEVLKKMKEEKDYSNLDSVAEEVQKRWYDVSAKAYQTQQPQGGGMGMNPEDLIKNGFGGMGAAPNTENIQEAECEVQDEQEA